MLTILLTACALHLGRPEIAVPRVSVGDVVVPAVQPGLREALVEGLAAALSARGALAGSGGDVAVDIVVREASTSVFAASDGGQVLRVRLSVEVQLYGPRPRSVVLSDERSYTVLPGRSLEAAEARASAFQALSRGLTEDAADWILLAPGAEK